LRSRRVSSASKSPNCIISHRSNWCSPSVRPVPTGKTSPMLLHLRLRSWLCRSTKEPSGFLVNHWKPHELGVVSAIRHLWLGSHVVPARPWFWGSTMKPSMTSSCRSCHHAANTWLCWPPGPSNETYLSSPHPEASPAATFHTCSLPAPTPVKPQPAPAILSQESVPTTLSITHHTRKRPSTGPRTTHDPQSPPWQVHWQHTHIVTWEKRKRKETNKKNLQQAIESQTKANRKITWRRHVSDPLGNDNGSTHARRNYGQENSANHQTKARKTTKSSSCTHAISPWTNATPPGRMHANHLKKTEQLHQLNPDQSDRSTPPVRPVCNMWTGLALWPVRPVTSTSQTDAQQSSEMARNHLKTF
jgi:hypothetical protein